MKEYELWIDESGDFRPDSQTRKNRFPSLVGGVLIEKDKFTEQELRKLVSGGLIDPLSAHGTEFTLEKKREIILPALEKICERGGKLVYFENQERLSHYSHKELYLRLLAAGLLQLIQLLAAREGEFAIDIEIAQTGIPLEDLRGDERPSRLDRGYRTVLIRDQEYMETLKAYIAQEWKNRHFVISDRCHVNFSVMDARREMRLKLADYADNSRITRNSEAFSGVFGDRLKELFDEDYIFSVTANTSENIIQTALAEENLATALTELYTGHGDIDHEDLFEEIMEHFEDISFRPGRMQLNKFVNTLVVYAQHETDFEQVEAVLKRVLEELFPAFDERGIDIQDDLGQFWLLLSLTDMYLREGDLKNAGEVLDRLDTLIRNMNYRLESIRPLYFYTDKRALYEINCMDYDAAEKTIGRSIEALQILLANIRKCGDLGAYFGGQGELHSEYLGNALTMRIYSKMFRQRLDHGVYDSLVEDSDLALRQYEFEGELERNQQYRAHIEMEQGKYQEALQWLLRTRELELENLSEAEDLCDIYLAEAAEEDPLSRTYYLMYYAEILSEAQRHGRTDVAEPMAQALWKNEDMMAMLSGRPAESDLHSDSGTRPRIFLDITQAALSDRTQLYHPIEIVWWKYAVYLYLTGRRREAAKLFIRAEKKCEERTGGSTYLTMRVTGLGIRLEEISLRMEYQLGITGNDSMRLQSDMTLAPGLDALQQICDRLAEEQLPEKIRAYVERVKTFAAGVKQSGTYNKAAAEEALALSRYIGY